MLFGSETVGRIGSSRCPCPPIVGSTYSTWARTETTAKRQQLLPMAKEIFSSDYFGFSRMGIWVGKEFLRATFFRLGDMRDKREIGGRRGLAKVSLPPFAEVPANRNRPERREAYESDVISAPTASGVSRPDEFRHAAVFQSLRRS